MSRSKDKLRICIIGPGHNIHTRRWVNGMAQLGHQVLLVSTEAPGPVDAEVFYAYDHIGKWSRIPKIRALLAAREILRKIRAFKADLVHMHWLAVHPVYLHIARRVHPFMISVWGKDIVWDDTSPQPPRIIRLKKKMLAAACEVTATTQFLADQTAPFLNNGRCATVVRWGVDVDRFSPADGASKMEPQSTAIVGFLKHYHPKYGPDIFLRAIPSIHSRAPELRFEMYGAQPFDRYQELAVQLSIDHLVTFHGAVAHDQVCDAMRRFYVYVMPSVYESETFGVSAVEAAACGVPVVASRVGGVPEAVNDSVTGLLVPPGDPKAVADAVIRLAEDRDLRNKMAAAGPRFVRRHYQWSESLERMESIYRRIVNTVPPRKPRLPGA